MKALCVVYCFIAVGDTMTKAANRGKEHLTGDCLEFPRISP